MLEVIETRELIELHDVEGIVRGTYHKTHAVTLDSQSNQSKEHRVGILFVNSMSPTRAANGDAAVYLADSFAERGYPSFRIDLPGFGDSDGDPAPDLHSFVNLGGYGAITSAKIGQLVARFNLTGVIIVGQCAGAVSAIHAAAASKECKGLVLMGPYFHLPQGKTPAKPREQVNPWYATGRFGKIWVSASTLHKKIRSFLPKNSPPQNANFALLRLWKQVASKGLPILVLSVPDRKASGVKGKAVEFDYLKYARELAGRKSRVVAKVADGANQSFSNRPGRESVRHHVELWLNACFPVKDQLQQKMSALQVGRSEVEHQRETREDYLYQ